MPYPILLIKVGISPIKSMAMTTYLMYKHKINNMGNERLPKIALNSSQNQLRLYTSTGVRVKIPWFG